MQNGGFYTQIQQVNKRTGEIVRTIPLPEFGKRKRNRDGEITLFHHNTKRIDLKRTTRFPPVVNVSDLGRLLLLSYYMDERNRIIIGMKDIARVVHLSEKRSRAFIQSATEAGILGRTTTGIYMNPCYFASCIYLPYEVYPLFRDDLMKLLPIDVCNEYDKRMQTIRDDDNSTQARGFEKDEA